MRVVRALGTADKIIYWLEGNPPRGRHSRNWHEWPRSEWPISALRRRSGRGHRDIFSWRWPFLWRPRGCCSVC